MEKFCDVIDAFGGPAAFGEAIGVADSHARTMKARDSIPPAHWQRVIAASIIKSIPGISVDLLMRLAAKPAHPRQICDQHLISSFEASS